MRALHLFGIVVLVCLAAGCSKGEPASEPAPEPEAEPVEEAEAVARFEPTGIQECDDALTYAYTCMDKLPGSAAAPMMASLKVFRDEWVKAAGTPGAMDVVKQGCTDWEKSYRENPMCK